MKIKEIIRREIAERIVEQSGPGYDTDFMGEYYAVDTDGDGMFDAVMHKEEQAPWSPWSDDAVVVAVADFYIYSDCDFDPTPDEDLIGDMDPDDDPAYDAAEEAAIDLAYSELPEEYEI